MFFKFEALFTRQLVVLSRHYWKFNSIQPRRFLSDWLLAFLVSSLLPARKVKVNNPTLFLLAKFFGARDEPINSQKI